MPNVSNRFTNDYLDTATENLRKCLRDLKKVSDRPTALASRERCKHWMDEAVKVFNELRDEYDETLFDLKGTVAELTVLGERFDYLVERIADVRREILTIDELAKLAEDMNYGEMVNVK